MTTKIESQHTPLPWTAEGFCIGHRSEKLLGSTKGLVAIFGQDAAMSGDEVQANIQFTLRAANSHAELVSALKNAKAYLEIHATDPSARKAVAQIDRACERLSKALKHLTGLKCRDEETEIIFHRQQLLRIALKLETKP